MTIDRFKQQVIEQCIKENLDLRYFCRSEIEEFMISAKKNIPAPAHRRQFIRDLNRYNLELRLFLTNNITLREFAHFTYAVGNQCKIVFSCDQNRFLEIYKEKYVPEFYIILKQRKNFDTLHIKRIKEIIKELIK